MVTADEWLDDPAYHEAAYLKALPSRLRSAIEVSLAALGHTIRT